MTDAQMKALGEAEEIFILGWSMPRTDAYHEGLIRVCSQHRRQKLSRLVIVNRSAPREYFTRVRAAFGDCGEVEAYNDGFADFLDAIGA